MEKAKKFFIENQDAIILWGMFMMFYQLGVRHGCKVGMRFQAKIDSLIIKGGR